MTYFEIVVAHLVVQFVIMLMQNTIMLIVFYVIFGYNFEGSIGLAMFIIVTVNCVGISFGNSFLFFFNCIRLFLILSLTEMGSLAWQAPCSSSQVSIRLWQVIIYSVKTATDWPSYSTPACTVPSLK